ncbi:MAG TPA: tetratricopeptide repeat protein [Gaiellaceae bacterium]|nr:tetratricopeptide repeat protein [Gaiellaceae bacterium]
MRSDLPSGTVTFLFTDVQGSTRLLHSLGAEAYADALAEHRRVIREACAAGGGVEVDTQGDAFFFAFPTAPGALAAAAAFTEALSSGPIQVRVGLHTGTPLLTAEGYVGDDVHFAARVAASAHGGQVVLSQATARAVRPSGSEPQALPLLDLGEHRLKDVSQAVSIFQLGEGAFPPLKTISNTNLPRPASSFVGRETELAEVLSRIEGGARLLTLTGPGGSGKTRLALEAAASLVSEYKAGVFWVGLASLRDPALVAETVAQTLGAKDGLAEHIGEREMLLLLDNLEQVVEAAPELASLLERCPNLTLLVTSRELLRVRGEVEYPVPPLAAPEAVALFCERSGHEPSEEIAELCVRLDSLPLAVELAAARTKALTPAQILERLSHRLDLLKGGRDADPRQQTLRATIEWSFELLTPTEQELFARLSVFAGGCTLEAAKEVCDADLDRLQSLVEKSLVRFSDGRYWMLEMIREFADERLARASESAAMRQRHAAYLLQLTRGVDERIQGPEVLEVLGALERESDNIRGAFEWMQRSTRADAELDLIGQIWRFWIIRAALREGLQLVERALARSDEESHRRSVTLRVAAVLNKMLGDLDAAEAYGRESLALRRRLGDPEEVAHGLSLLASVAADRGDLPGAQWMYEEAAALGRGGHTHTQAMLAGSLADVAMRRGDYEGALTLAEESAALFRELVRDDGVSWASFTVALALYSLDRQDEAVGPAVESLALAHAMAEVETIVWVLLLLAAVVMRRGEVMAAARLFGAAEGLRDRSQLALSGVESRLHDETLHELRRCLDTRSYEDAFADGRSMSLEEAVEYALASLD